MSGSVVVDTHTYRVLQSRGVLGTICQAVNQADINVNDDGEGVNHNEDIIIADTLITIIHNN